MLQADKPIPPIVALFLYVLVFLMLSACASSTMRKTGTLELTIQGLTGIEASITVTGPSGFNQTLKVSSKLENLTVGDYTVSASDVVQSDIYFPDKRQQSVVVKRGETTSLAITYSKQNPNKGSLEVTIEGLSVDIHADVSVSDPNGFSQQLITSSVLSNLTPGNYQLTANIVMSGNDTYAPIPTSQSVAITASNKVNATVTYSKQIPTLGQLAISISGLPTGLKASVSVSGPNDFSEDVAASTTFENLPPGDYEITTSQVYSDYIYRPYPLTQILKVVAGERTNALIGFVPTILPDRTEGFFGISVAVDGDIMVVGASTYDSPTQNSVGAAYLYRRTPSGEWIFRKLLVPDTQFTDARVGASVAVSGDTVVVGAPGAITSQTCDSGGQNCTNIIRGGLAYVFKRDVGGPNNFGHFGELRASSVLSPLKDEDNFGASVAVHDDGNSLAIAVGMPGYDHDLDENGTVECDTTTFAECSVGATYVYFSDTTSSGVMRLLADDKNRSDEFGSAVAISGDMLIVGAERDTFDADGDGSEDCGSTTGNSECFIGSAYLFECDAGGSNNWGQVTKLLPSDGQIDDRFGAFIAIEGDTIALGTRNSDGGQTKAFVSIFERNQDGADAWGEVKKLSIVGVFNGFDAASVAVHDDKVMVGVPNLNGDVNGDGSVDCQEPFPFLGQECQTGGVFVFRRDEGGVNNFGLMKTFVAVDSQRENKMGRAVAFDGETMVAGAAGFPINEGAVYVLGP